VAGDQGLTRPVIAAAYREGCLFAVQDPLFGAGNSLLREKKLPVTLPVNLLLIRPSCDAATSVRRRLPVLFAVRKQRNAHFNPHCFKGLQVLSFPETGFVLSLEWLRREHAAE
jgi:hypothetical protein